MNTLQLAQFKRHLLQEISFEKGHAGDNDLKSILRQVLSIGSFNTNSVTKKFDKINAFNGSDPNYGLRDVPAFEKIVKSQALDVISDGSGPELLILNNREWLGDKGYIFTITNPNALTIGEYFIGLIKVSIVKKSKYSISLSDVVELPALQIGWSNIANEWRGKGLGKQLYSLVYKWATSKGFALASDSTLFEGSAAMWTNYMPEIASYFGVVINNIIIPISKEEAQLDKFKFFNNADGFIAFENPPKLLRKLLYNFQGLSYSKGQIVVIGLEDYSINKPLDENGEFDIFDYVEQNDSISELLKSLRKDVQHDADLDSFFPFAKSQASAQVAILLFKDSVLIVKTVSTGEREVLPKDKRKDKKGNKIKPKMIKRLVAVTL